MINSGIFTISLDFELYWGMRDVVSVEGYADNLQGTPDAIKRVLLLFKEYDIHTTWATLGFLFCKDIEEVRKYSPKLLPSYRDDEINLYRYMEQNQLETSYHFAPDSIDLIASFPNQEIATHTFSHYYCLEDGQSEKEFKADLEASMKIALKRDIKLTSLVFPRNQYNKHYLDILKKVGITSYRGNEKGWIYEAKSEKEKKTPIKRLLRIIDSYIDISGYHTYKFSDISKQSPHNIPASRFLRPSSAKLSFLDSFRLKRITDAMTYAAKNGELFHLWWHPHNFGVDTDANLAFLTKILKHFKMLNSKYQMRSLTMGELSLELNEKDR